MAITVHQKLRLSLLVVALGLIGGTGCITTGIVKGVASGVQSTIAQRESFQRQEADTLLAANGSPEAMTRLAAGYLALPPPNKRNARKGIELLERAAALQFAPAEYALGGLLISRSGAAWAGYLYADEAPLQPQRGADLIKRAASRICGVQWSSVKPAQTWLAFDISARYRTGIGVAKDFREAQLWLARSVLHCSYPEAVDTLNAVVKFSPSGTLTPIETLGWLLLYRTADVQAQKMVADLRTTLSEADIQLAQQRAEQLGNSVTDSEKQYPAPARAVTSLNP